MTSLQDLLWLYKMAIQFNLEDEKEWLKLEIEERLAKTPAHTEESEKEAA